MLRSVTSAMRLAASLDVLSPGDSLCSMPGTEADSIGQTGWHPVLSARLMVEHSLAQGHVAFGLWPSAQLFLYARAFSLAPSRGVQKRRQFAQQWHIRSWQGESASDPKPQATDKQAQR